MSKDGHRPNGITFNTLLDYLCKNGGCTEARKIFDSMVHRGLKPNDKTYCILLHGCAANGSLADMHDFLDLMVRDGISFDNHVFNVLIYAYAERQMVNEALLVFTKM